MIQAIQPAASAARTVLVDAIATTLAHAIAKGTVAQISMALHAQTARATLQSSSHFTVSYSHFLLSLLSTLIAHFAFFTNESFMLRVFAFTAVKPSKCERYCFNNSLFPG